MPFIFSLWQIHMSHFTFPPFLFCSYELMEEWMRIPIQWVSVPTSIGTYSIITGTNWLIVLLYMRLKKRQELKWDHNVGKKGNNKTNNNNKQQQEQFKCFIRDAWQQNSVNKTNKLTHMKGEKKNEHNANCFLTHNKIGYAILAVTNHNAHCSPAIVRSFPKVQRWTAITFKMQYNHHRPSSPTIEK